MSVLIDIDMPPNCESCPLRMEYDDESFCPFSPEPIDYWLAAGKRSEKCSLVEMSDGQGDLVEKVYDLVDVLDGYYNPNNCETMMLDKALRKSIAVLLKAVDESQLEEMVSASVFRDCRNELCLKCGSYKQAHKGACEGCRWKE